MTINAAIDLTSTRLEVMNAFTAQLMWRHSLLDQLAFCDWNCLARIQVLTTLSVTWLLLYRSFNYS